MGIRFHRSFKILPGLRLNVSKKGLGVSAGVKGARVSVGSSGVRQTTGIPGTGISFINQVKLNPKRSQVTENFDVSRQIEILENSLELMVESKNIDVVISRYDDAIRCLEFLETFEKKKFRTMEIPPSAFMKKMAENKQHLFDEGLIRDWLHIKSSLSELKTPKGVKYRLEKFREKVEKVSPVFENKKLIADMIEETFNIEKNLDEGVPLGSTRIEDGNVEYIVNTPLDMNTIESPEPDQPKKKPPFPKKIISIGCIGIVFVCLFMAFLGSFVNPVTPTPSVNDIVSTSIAEMTLQAPN